MRTIKILLVVLFALYFSDSYAQTARLQVIHNSDRCFGSTDIYLNGIYYLKFRFREATPYIDVPAGTPIKYRCCAW